MLRALPSRRRRAVQVGLKFRIELRLLLLDGANGIAVGSTALAAAADSCSALFPLPGRRLFKKTRGFCREAESLRLLWLKSQIHYSGPAQVHASRADGRYMRTARGGWVVRPPAQPIIAADVLLHCL